jgi:hypothetical protein
VQFFNPIYVVIFAPMFAAFWAWLGRRNLDPSLPLKFALGLFFMGMSFLVMLLAVGVALESAPIGLQWLLITYLLQTWGELALSPIGLSAFSRYSPKRYVGQMFGLWFLASAIGGVLAGLLGGEATDGGLEQYVANLFLHGEILLGHCRGSCGVGLFLSGAVKRVTLAPFRRPRAVFSRRVVMRFWLKYFAIEACRKGAPMQVTIRPFKSSDASNLQRAILGSVGHVGQWLEWCTPRYTLSSARSWLQESKSLWDEGTAYRWAIEPTDAMPDCSNQILGCVEITSSKH